MQSRKKYNDNQLCGFWFFQIVDISLWNDKGFQFYIFTPIQNKPKLLEKTTCDGIWSEVLAYKRIQEFKQLNKLPEVVITII